MRYNLIYVDYSRIDVCDWLDNNIKDKTINLKNRENLDVIDLATIVINIIVDKI